MIQSTHVTTHFTANTNQQRPFIHKNTHPIETRKYLLPTNEINRLYDKLKQCIINRFPGAIIHGRPRLGKTGAIKYLMHILPDEFDTTPMYFFLCRRYKNPNEGTFFEDLLKDLGHSAAFSGKANVKRVRLLKFLLEQADTAGQNRIIFFIDDAQRLHEIHYDWLMDIYNELDRAGISLTVFLVGQDELLHQRSVFLELGKHQIIGRFMVQQHQFKGIMNINDLRECLSGYDENCEYPHDSGWSYTHYYFPEAFDNNYRLENCAEDIYKVFEQLRTEAGIRKKSFEIPMQYLTLTIEYALRNFGADGKELDWLNQNNWVEAVKNSGYIEAEIYQGI